MKCGRLLMSPILANVMQDQLARMVMRNAALIFAKRDRHSAPQRPSLRDTGFETGPN